MGPRTWTLARLMHPRSVHRLSKRLVLAVLFSVLLPSSAWAKPSVLLFPAIGRPTQVTISGRALKKETSQKGPALKRNLKRLLASNWEGAPVEVRFAGRVLQTTSGHDGEFQVTFPAPASSPFAVGERSAEATIPGASASVRVEVISDEGPFFVVSDFDDTVAVSNVTSEAGLIESGLLEDAYTQPVVPGMAAFYRCLRGERDPQPGFAFVSGTPAQYSPRMEAFLAGHAFPFAGLYLRNLGPKTLSGYKEPMLRRLLFQFPQKVVLVGDSGEKDPEVYAEIRREFPDRVAAIFIRCVWEKTAPERFEGMFVFDEVVDAAREAVAKGFVSQACFEREFGS
jgi:phosphatidate phosphatase APP1